MSFRMKTIAGIAIIQTFLLLIIIWATQSLMQQSNENELRQRAVTAARLFAITSKEAVLTMDLASLKGFVEEVLKNPDFAYARVRTPADRILAEAGLRSLLDKPFKADRDTGKIDDDVFDTAAPVEEAGITYGWVEIGISTRTILNALDQAQTKATHIAAGEIVLSILLSWLLGSYLVRRIHRLKEASEQIAAGSLGYQIDMDGHDEIAATAEAFNEMSLRLQDSLAEIHGKNRSLRAEITKRQEAEARLQKAHEELENRVTQRTEELAAANVKLKNEIEERRAAEIQNKELEARLQRIRKMEALGALAGGVAHDLNNVLSGIVTYPDLLLLQLSPENPMKKPLEMIRDSGLKAAAIVQDLLTLARRGVMAKEVLNINRVVTDYLESPEHLKIMSRNRNIRVKADLQEDLLNMEGSGVHLSKTIMNLVSNAAEAMPQGGEITVKTQNRYVGAPVKGYDAIVEGDYVVVSVADQGQGIASEDLEKIFEPFYTKKIMGRSGTGLGMAVVWGTVKDHDGYVDVVTTNGRGSTFFLYFPCTRKQLPQAPSKVPPDMYRGKGEKILVVDDVAQQREIAAALLAELGYSAETVPSGEAALDYLSEHSAALIILDMIMAPGMDGLDTYKAITRIHPEQKVLIASGFSETERVRQAQRMGAGAYIKKPYTIEKIGLALRRCLDRC